MTLAKHVLMIEPLGFHFNPQTSRDNYFQGKPKDPGEVQVKAALEFEGLRKLLVENGIAVDLIKIQDDFVTPDSIFPNNWFSTHPNGVLVLYPMMAANRRLERRSVIIDELHKHYPLLIDLSRNEERGLYLEGTGSIVIDHNNKRAYAALSDRTSSNLLYEWSKKMDFETVTFSAYDKEGKIIYHTNVLLSIGEGFCILCKEAIRDTDELRLITKALTENGHEIIEISLDQLKKFCGNCLQLTNEAGERFLVMSTQAYEAFLPEQIQQLQKHTKIIHSPLHTIESQGGGGARCMIAELF